LTRGCRCLCFQSAASRIQYVIRDNEIERCNFIHRENKKEIKNLSNTLPLYLAPKKMINLYNTHIENLSIHRVGNKSRNEAIFLSEQPFTLNDEMCL
jgi:hypothetical protein